MKDLAIRRLSYSAILALHKCPRYFFLSRHNFGDKEESVHLAYGKAFGTGIQEIMKGSSLEKAWFAAFMAWDINTEEELEKDKKSLWFALLMVSKFANETWPAFKQQGWQLLFFKEKASDEFGYKLNMQDGFYIIGFIDAVLYNPATSEIKVLEIKTTKYSQVSDALYANSQQALGYGVILDKLLASLEEASHQSYEVLYLVMKSNALEIELLPFKKNRVQKATWLRDVSLDIQRIQGYEEEGYWPKHGESCFNYAAYKPCEYFGVCDMSLKGIFLKNVEQLNEVVAAKEAKEEANEVVSLNVSLNEIIESQLAGV
jgi:hypothetical protein